MPALRSADQSIRPRLCPSVTFPIGALDPCRHSLSSAYSSPSSHVSEWGGASSPSGTAPGRFPSFSWESPSWVFQFIIIGKEEIDWKRNDMKNRVQALRLTQDKQHLSWHFMPLTWSYHDSRIAHLHSESENRQLTTMNGRFAQDGVIMKRAFSPYIFYDFFS